MGSYNRFLTMLSTEFQRYLMENEKPGEKIPQNAKVKKLISVKRMVSRKGSLGNGNI